MGVSTYASMLKEPKVANNSAAVLASVLKMFPPPSSEEVFTKSGTGKPSQPTLVDPQGVLGDAGWKTLLIQKHPRDSKVTDMRRTLERFGTIKMINIIGSKCYSFVRFCESEAAQAALNSCATGHVIMFDAKGKAWHLRADWASSPFGFNKRGKRLRGHGAKSNVLSKKNLEVGDRVYL